MKKYISIVLLFIYLFSFQEFRQVLKFPFFIEQFIKHEIINQDYTIFGFFEHHYLRGNVIDNDYQQDMKMPFKTYDFSANNTIISTPISFENFEIEKPQIIVKEQKHNFTYLLDFISEIHLKIFQPPEIFNFFSEIEKIGF